MGLILHKGLIMASNVLRDNMLNFVDCENITIFDVGKDIKGNGVRGSSKGSGLNSSVAGRAVGVRAHPGFCTGSL